MMAISAIPFNRQPPFQGSPMSRRQYTTCFILASTLSAFLNSPAPGQRVKRDDSSRPRAEKRDSEVTDLEVTRFIRLKRDSEGNPIALQTSLTRYEDPQRRIVIDLIGAVHIGEANYYKRLNKQFTLYDAVLYELVAPAGTRVPAGGHAADNPIAWLQQAAKDALGLESQLDRIDYQRDNFVHADLSLQQMGDKMRERGDTPLTLGLSALAEMLREQNRKAESEHGAPADEPSIESMGLNDFINLIDNPLELKRLLATQFAETGALERGLGPRLNQLLVADRNQAAMEVLHRELAAGKRKIAIFYGAAHLPDFERRILEQLELKRTHHVWVDAWDLTHAPERSNSIAIPDFLKPLLESLNR